jgi:hypothetical protein
MDIKKARLLLSLWSLKGNQFPREFTFNIIQTMISLFKSSNKIFFYKHRSRLLDLDHFIEIYI